MNTQELRNLLSQHHGTEDYYQHPLNKSLVYTDGFKAFLDNAGGGAHWFGDILATDPRVAAHMRHDYFACVHLISDGASAYLYVSSDVDEDGEPLKDVLNMVIPYTDCPAGTWTFYLEHSVVGDQTATVAMLTSER